MKVRDFVGGGACEETVRVGQHTEPPMFRSFKGHHCQFLQLVFMALKESPPSGAPPSSHPPIRASLLAT